MSISSPTSSISTAFLMGQAPWNVSLTSFAPPALAPQISLDIFRPPGWNWHNPFDAQSMVFIKSQPCIAEMQYKEGEEGTPYGYFFDAFVREGHSAAVKITEHPVQGGANISDHAYNLPDKLTLEIFVSDSMDCLMMNQFSMMSTKSISAYQALRDMKEKRQPLSVMTRLYFYENMLIETMTTTDDYKSKNSLRCTVQLRQIIMATVSTETVKSDKEYSAKPKTTEVKSPEKSEGSTVLNDKINPNQDVDENIEVEGE